jgi:hypothetical protein
MGAMRVVAALLLLLGTSCGEAKSCTMAGSFEGVIAILKTDSGAWPDGAYDAEVDVPNRTLKCHWAFTDPLSRTNLRPNAKCDTGLQAELWQRNECVETKQGNAVRQSCTLIDDQYDLWLFVSGTPRQLTVRMSRDSSEILSERREPLYSDDEPNGPGCGVVRSASVDLTVAP